jgi:hypothetical protein
LLLLLLAAVQANLILVLMQLSLQVQMRVQALTPLQLHAHLLLVMKSHAVLLPRQQLRVLPLLAAQQQSVRQALQLLLLSAAMALPSHQAPASS